MLAPWKVFQSAEEVNKVEEETHSCEISIQFLPVSVRTFLYFETGWLFIKFPINNKHFHRGRGFRAEFSVILPWLRNRFYAKQFFFIPPPPPPLKTFAFRYSVRCLIELDVTLSLWDLCTNNKSVSKSPWTSFRWSWVEGHVARVHLLIGCQEFRKLKGKGEGESDRDVTTLQWLSQVIRELSIDEIGNSYQS